MRKILGPLRRAIMRNSKRCESRVLANCRGVVHIGANVGQERFEYGRLALPVLWVEPIPTVFETLLTNIRPFPEQRAIKYLLTDEDGRKHQFNVSTNSGVSSSILDLHMCRDIWPEVAYSGKIELVSERFLTVVQREGIIIQDYDYLVLDTQGSELMVLQGFGDLLQNFSFIKTEAADFEGYVNCCTIERLSQFFSMRGFKEIDRHLIAPHPTAGAYYDLLYQNEKVGP